MQTSRRVVIPLVIATVVGLAALASAWSAAIRVTPSEAAQAAQARDAFVTVASVLRHPRCLNCHPSSDVPRVGDERRQHAMNVQRGPANNGMPAMHCSACHQPANQDLAGVPGAPLWRLAPRSMGWEGLDDHMLAETLKDRARNGDRSLADLLHHMEHDPLVGWAWAPGAGRSTPPISREAFVEAFKNWIEFDAVSPPPGNTTY